MSRKRGPKFRQHHLRVRTERREPIDYEALARAVLEQAAQQQHDYGATVSDKPQSGRQTNESNDAEGDSHAHLA